ncbi:hypothetical protein AC579_1242 [Pseudocercospora musae]|uniref:Uncharacterized protein n=1 Tax=Pseudocercospora musae TaxID=113226 RepID=A0A139I5V7_9PEZI|nr:hypothetical protein AC579_1242 [Pseudocercospora musae]
MDGNLAAFPLTLTSVHRNCHGCKLGYIKAFPEPNPEAEARAENQRYSMEAWQSANTVMCHPCDRALAPVVTVSSRSTVCLSTAGVRAASQDRAKRKQ